MIRVPQFCSMPDQFTGPTLEGKSFGAVRHVLLLACAKSDPLSKASAEEGKEGISRTFPKLNRTA